MSSISYLDLAFLTFMRAQLGSVCYGFQPSKTEASMDEMLKMTHGIDERISVENLVFGTSVLYRLVERFMT